MKRGRKPAPAPAPGRVPPELYALAKARLEGDYLAVVTGTSPEDLRALSLRIAAAGELLGHLAQLGALATPAEAAPDDAARTQDVLAEARADMARENKS